jgi:hypothetical protein
MRLFAVLLAATLFIGGPVQAQSAAAIEVYKSPTCGCCSKWMEHMRQHGFAPRVADISDDALDALKAKHGVPRTAQSCHTALVGGYVIEGHVPATEVKRLLKERPAVAGIAVAGMPLGSPGMEVPDGRVQIYNVITFSKQGDVRVFATHGR